MKYIWSFKTTPTLHLHNALLDHNNLSYNKHRLLTIRKKQLRKPKLARQNNFRSTLLRTKAHWPSLIAEVKFRDLPHTGVKRKSASNWAPPPLKKQCFSIILEFFFSESCRSELFFLFFSFSSPSTPWTSYGLARRPVRLFELFSCSFPLKGPSEVFLFLGQPHRCAKLRSAKQRKARV